MLLTKNMAVELVKRRLLWIHIVGVFSFLLYAHLYYLIFETLTTNRGSSNKELTPCPDGPIVTAVDSGRFGNKFWQYATAWTMARILNRTAFVPRIVLHNLTRIFANLTIPALEDIEHCNISLEKPINKTVIRDKMNEGLQFEGENLNIDHKYILFEAILPFRQILRSVFRFREDLLDLVRQTIEEVGGKGQTLVGVHVRRTDFVTFLPKSYKTQLVNATFFKNAMQWYRDQFPGPLMFLVVSDDIPWCRKNLLDEDDVKIASKSPEHDLALLSVCNHTILDYGTFGHTAAFLSKGHTVALYVNDKYFTSVMAREANWTLLSKGDYKEMKRKKPPHKFQPLQWAQNLAPPTIKPNLFVNG
ncbi:galactoside alpha-(1,2)-fucosyltransferase 1-like [Neocloeon triangulifer]|uniref:galactoside alpha-(1,2)-fucosyltransferase 1-like n=1 Tax=Neocloeon triangulifer TaxID=2078957 RepID=UPI00286F4605|nr:galactoside alpha-(1,2)-fucosyltransferase 1-like [Neocloeon triangulifer]